MCGRKTLTVDMQAIISELAVEEWEDPESYFPSYNSAPTQSSPVLLDTGKRVVKAMRWGLVPSWAREASIGSRMINARAETLPEKPSFKPLLPRRRCVVIADGYYEWRKTATGRIPYYIRHPEEKLLPLAGLWDTWRGAADETLNSYTIITTRPQAAIDFIHDRMPVVLPAEGLDIWLQTDRYPVAEALGLLKPYPVPLHYYPVSRFVNVPRNNSPRCIQPVEEEDERF